MLDFGYYNMDCMQGMKEFPDGYFDLAIVDPPYGINAGKMHMGSGKHQFAKGKDWDAGIPSREYFDELFRVSINQIIWGGNYFTEYLKPSPHWIVWDKMNPNLSFAEGELAWVNQGDNLRIFQYYTVKATTEDPKIHPTQKPIKLYKWLLNRYAHDGDKILDTHVGSASSLIACEEMGYEYVGFEIDAEYYAKGMERIKTHRAQLSIMELMNDWRLP